MSDLENNLEISPEIMNQIKRQVIEEMRSEEKRKEEENTLRRTEEKKQHDEFVETMKISSDPWVEIIGWGELKDGVRIELDWNEPFITELKSKGFSGADEDQIVQKWIIMLMHDLSNENEDGDYE